jgi:thymidylate synthase
MDIHPEYQYLNIIKDLIETGHKKNDRTGTGTLSKFGHQMRFSLRDNIFPLLTTKKVFWKGVVEELLWFIRGDTNANHLSEKGVKIWDSNGSRDFLDKCGFKDREVGDLGPVYGFQWRHFGAEYQDMNTDYDNKGYDQLQTCIKQIKEDPDNRRIIMMAWNPSALHLMALPPCHMFCQFYVSDGELSCLMYQRSCDMGLGVPFNIASYALLTRIMAHVTGLKPGELIHMMGDTHIYLNHIEPLKLQLTRQPKPFPKLEINTQNMEITKFTIDDFELVGYDPHPTIKMEMAI